MGGRRGWRVRRAQVEEELWSGYQTKVEGAQDRWEKFKRRRWREEMGGRKTGMMGVLESKPIWGRIVVPFLLNGREVWGLRDDGSDMSLFDQTFKSKLELGKKFKMYSLKALQMSCGGR